MPYRILWVVLGGLLANLAQAYCAKPLSVGFAEWPPYQSLHDGKYTGFDSEFIEIVSKQFACPLLYLNMPWNAQQDSVRLGKLDLALGVTETPERDNYAYFSEPYRQETIRLFVLADNLHKYNIASVAALKDVSFLLGAELGFYYGPEFSDLLHDQDFAQQVRMVIYTKINVQKLADQRIDAFIADQEVAQYYIAQLGLSEKIVELPLIVNQSAVRVMVGKSAGSVAFVAQLNAEISKSLKSEKYKLLQAKYLKK